MRFSWLLSIAHTLETPPRPRHSTDRDKDKDQLTAPVRGPHAYIHDVDVCYRTAQGTDSLRNCASSSIASHSIEADQSFHFTAFLPLPSTASKRTVCVITVLSVSDSVGPQAPVLPQVSHNRVRFSITGAVWVCSVVRTWDLVCGFEVSVLP